jgi:hypothetical protein
VFFARIIYARGWSITSPIIRRWPDSAPALWSHAGILLSPHDDEEGQAMVWHATWPRGFHRVTTEQFGKRYRTYEVVRYEVQATPEQQRSWCEHRAGWPYAVGTVIGRMLGLRASERGDHCSEVAENALRDWGCVARWRSDHHLITPNVSYHNLCGVSR